MTAQEKLLKVIKNMKEFGQDTRLLESLLFEHDLLDYSDLYPNG